MTNIAAGGAPQAPTGIGGWLILPAIGLVASPIMVVVTVVKDLLPAFEDDTWQMLTTPGSAVYHHLTAPLLIYEVVVDIALVIFALFLNYFFWQKSRRLPALAITWLAFAAVAVSIDTIVSLQIPLIAQGADGSFYKEMIRSIIGAAVWIPYFKVSKRVKNTFVN